MRHRAEPARTRHMAIGGAAASSDVWTWPGAAVHGNAVRCPQLRENQTLGGRSRHRPPLTMPIRPRSKSALFCCNFVRNKNGRGALANRVGQQLDSANDSDRFLSAARCGMFHAGGSNI